METYFVVMPDGQKFGPADVATLSSWAAEGRLFRESILESATSAERVSAGSVAGIQWPGPGPAAAAGPYANPPGGFADYPRAGGGMPMSWMDRQFANTSVIILCLAAFCCWCPSLIFAICGVSMCKDPKAKKNAQTMLIVCVVMIGVSVVLNLTMRGAQQVR